MDKAALELVRDWLTRADHDLRSARLLAGAADPLLDTAIYHCQQAAEKAIKAWLQSANALIPRTHDIEDLVEQASDTNPDFKQFAKVAAVLTPYASAFRYPGGFEEPMPSQDEFDEALKHAQTIYNFVLNLLPKEARP
ncbi:MAG: HEPN domain-containing protein [Verrucomicrobiae bacterium]|nr:HEPN domain-containing protein [Verrucomicrobiae bacterium]